MISGQRAPLNKDAAIVRAYTEQRQAVGQIARAFGIGRQQNPYPGRPARRLVIEWTAQL
jgi:hypothetical protein